MREWPRAIFAIGSLAVIASLATVRDARALPPPEAPRAGPTGSPTIAPAGTTLPYGSIVLLVLDDKISSASTVPGTVIHMHTQSPIVVDGTTIAAAGTPATLDVVTTRKAHSGDEDGAVQIHVEPLELPGRSLKLPLRAFHEYLTIDHTAGQLSTLSTTDTIGDIFIPGHFLYHALRPGRQMVLPVGTVLRVETDASVSISEGRVVLSTPPPFVSRYDTPHADLTAAPLATPAPERPRPLPKGKATLPPTPGPSPTTPIYAQTPVPPLQMPGPNRATSLPTPP